MESQPIGKPEIFRVPPATLSEISQENIMTSHRSSRPFNTKFGVENSTIF